MRQAHLTLLAAATLLSTAAQALASVNTEGIGLDPNRAQVDQAGGVVLSANFSGINFGSQFNPGSAPITHAGGSISGAFFGPAGTHSGLVDVTLATNGPRDASPRYAAPFLASTATAGALTPVPEPSSWVLMLVGVIGLAGWLSTRTRRSVPGNKVASTA